MTNSLALVGMIGCMILLVGGLGMKDTMESFMKPLDEDVSNYTTKINLFESAVRDEAEALAEWVKGDWQYTAGISHQGETVYLEVYHTDHNKIRFIDGDNRLLELGDEGVYLCPHLAGTADMENSDLIAGKQDKKALMETYGSFMDMCWAYSPTLSALC